MQLATIGFRLQKSGRADCAQQLFVLLMLPAYAIFAVVFGPQRTWLLLIILGLGQLAAAVSVLRHSRSSLTEWVALASGIMLSGAGIRFALTPW